ncbi:MAG: hypothetical protein ACR2JC_07305 [Chloroflexota bacterium]
MHEVIQGLIFALFGCVCALLVYGAWAFRASVPATSMTHGRRVNMRLEVVWTGLAAALLGAIFVVAH